MELFLQLVSSVNTVTVELRYETITQSHMFSFEMVLDEMQYIYLEIEVEVEMNGSK